MPMGGVTLVLGAANQALSVAALAPMGVALLMMNARATGPRWLGPVAPAGPVAPLGPVAPCGPLLPCGPEGPVAPAGPVAPPGPVGPCGPDGPVAPGTPAAPERLTCHVL